MKTLTNSVGDPNGWAIVGRGVVLLGMAAALSGAGRSVRAYDNDTHYVFTYYLARKMGYTAPQARRVASADISIDLDPNTEPFQVWKIINPTESAQRALSLYSRGSGNIGMYLHYFQDTFAHSGYYSLKGHALAGHRPDFLSNNKDQAKMMTERTMHLLHDFKDYALKTQTPDDTDQLKAGAFVVLHELVAANPPAATSSPDWEKARRIVARDLNETVPDWIVYHFSKDGEPTDAAGWKVFDGS